MDAKQLMIGNYIIFKKIDIDEYLTEESKLVMVDSIYLDIINDKYIINEHYCEFYDAILITEDWLHDFGLTYCTEFDEWFQYSDMSGYSVSRNYETGSWRIESFTIFYIHQLQNISKTLYHELSI